MSKIITAAQAAALVKDGCTLTTTGFNGFGCPEDLIMSLAAHYDQTGHPKRCDAGEVYQPRGWTGPGGESSGGTAWHVQGTHSLPTWDMIQACGNWFRRNGWPALCCRWET